MPNSSRITIISRLFNKLNREHFRSSVPRPEIRLSRRMTTTAGSVQYGRTQHILTISVPYHDHFGWDGELISTLKHEMIHLYLARYQGIRGHGKVFRSLCEALGTERYCKDLPRKDPLYVYECPTCGEEYRYRRKVRLFCGRCPRSARPTTRLLKLVRTVPPRISSTPKRDRARRATETQLPLPGVQSPLKQRAARQRKQQKKTRPNSSRP
jgi:predicted SprT family Zn-dependent metalloprotease